MTAQLMTGTGLAKDIIDRSVQRARSLLQETGVRPCLATVLVGEDPGSVTYVAMKRSRCAKAGHRLTARAAASDDHHGGTGRGHPGAVGRSDGARHLAAAPGAGAY